MKIEWKSCFKIGISIFILYLCIHYWEGLINVIASVIGAAFPLLVGFILAYLVNILMTFYERHYFTKSKKSILIKSRRPVCMTGAFLTLIAIIVFIFSLVIPQLVSCIHLLLTKLPDAIILLISFADKHNIIPDNIIEILAKIDWESRIADFWDIFSSGFGSLMDAVVMVVSSVFSGVVTGLLCVIFSIYLLLAKDKLKWQFRKVTNHYFSQEICRKVSYLFSVLDSCFHRYIVGQCTEAVILGGLCIAGMAILRLPYAAMIGALVAFTALIPIAGAYIGALVGVLMILTVSPVKALIFLIFIIILQQLEGNLIYPKVVGSSLGLPGIWVLAAVTVGGGLLGVGGMLFGVPVAAAVYRLIQEDVQKPRVNKIEIPDFDDNE